MTEQVIDRPVRPPATDATGAGRAIDPRIRQRRIEVKREEGRRRLRVLIALAAVLVTSAVGFGISQSPLFAVRHTRVVGAAHTSAQEVLRAGRLSGHPLMLDVDPTRSAAAIDELPWVGRAHVRRSWPNTVTVTVTERTPVARIGGALVDGTGRVLGPVPASPAVPQVQLAPPAAALAAGAVSPAPAASVAAVPDPGGTVDARYAPGLSVAAVVPPALLPHVLTIVVHADRTVVLSLTGGASAMLGDGTQLGQKLEAVLTLVDRVRIGNGTIDATVPSAPVLTGSTP